MASGLNDAPTSMADLLKSMQKQLTDLQRRRLGDGVNIDGQCEYGGGTGGDTSYYGGGTGDIGGGSTYTEGANIDIVDHVIHFAVDMSEPVSPRVGQVWLGP